MEIGEFLSLARKRRTIRRFKPDPIPDECIEQMIEAARWAMSGGNGQPWEFIIVKKPETKKKMADFCFEHRKRAYVLESIRIEELRQPIYRTVPDKPPAWGDAPVLIVCVGDPRTFTATVMSAHFTWGEGGPGATYFKNMANATQNLCLAAAALGLGASWISVGRGWEEPVRALLNVPIPLSVQTVVAVGYPDYEPPPTYRRELSEIMHFEKYDMTKYRSDEGIIEWLRQLRRKQTATYTFST